MVQNFQHPSADAILQRSPALPSIPSSSKLESAATPANFIIATNTPRGCNGGGRTISHQGISQETTEATETMLRVHRLAQSSSMRLRQHKVLLSILIPPVALLLIGNLVLFPWMWRTLQEPTVAVYGAPPKATIW